MRALIQNAGGIVTSAKLIATGFGAVGSQQWVQGHEKAIVGSTGQSPGAYTFNPQNASPASHLSASTLTFKIPQFTNSPFQSAVGGGSIPVSVVKKLLTTDTCIVIGNGEFTAPKWLGSWLGGPNSWTLTVKYTVIS